MGAKGETLARQFEAKVQEAVATLEKLRDADWGEVTEDEQWPVGVTAHHLAGVLEPISRMVEAVAAGQSPGLTRDVIDEMNARHAKDHAHCSRQETIELLTAGAAVATAVIRRLSDDQLARSGTVLTDAPPMTVEQLIISGLIGHVDEHFGSIRNTVGRRLERADTTTTATVTAITQSDAEQAIAVIVLAFSTDPVVRWTYSDPQQYLAHFPAIVRAFGGKAFAHGTGHHASGFAGAALWLPPGIQPDEEALVAVLRQGVPAGRQAAVFAVLEQMGRHHPHEPHWYLPLIGVDPVHQRRGHGSALLEHALRRCDRDRTPAYLESTNPANIPLYERHGFEVLATIQVGASPPIFPMLRAAR